MRIAGIICYYLGLIIGFGGWIVHVDPLLPQITLLSPATQLITTSAAGICLCVVGMAWVVRSFRQNKEGSDETA